MNPLASRRCLQVLAAFVLALTLSIAHADDVRVVYYDVSGNSAAALRGQLNANGPLDKKGQRFDAYTRWYVSWKYRYRPTASGCEFTTVTVSVEGTMTLPRWRDTHHASQALVRKWDHYIAALRLHEQGHYVHGLDAARDIRKLGQSFRASGACPAFLTNFNVRASAIIARYAAMDAAYDRETGHGKAQGATFP